VVDAIVSGHKYNNNHSNQQQFVLPDTLRRLLIQVPSAWCLNFSGGVCLLVDKTGNDDIDDPKPYLTAISCARRKLTHGEREDVSVNDIILLLSS
jgi:hypothetical protein